MYVLKKYRHINSSNDLTNTQLLQIHIADTFETIMIRLRTVVSNCCKVVYV